MSPTQQHYQGALLKSPLNPGIMVLRRALRANCVSFPSQIPALLNRPCTDMQCRIVLLFFVRGWRSSKIAVRYNIPKHRVWSILNDWCCRALALGYLQIIDPEKFCDCARSDDEARDVVRKVVADAVA